MKKAKFHFISFPLSRLPDYAKLRSAAQPAPAPPRARCPARRCSPSEGPGRTQLPPCQGAGRPREEPAATRLAVLLPSYRRRPAQPGGSFLSAASLARPRSARVSGQTAPREPVRPPGPTAAVPLCLPALPPEACGRSPGRAGNR